MPSLATQPLPVVGPVLPQSKNAHAAKANAGPLAKLSTLLVCDDPQLLLTLTHALGHFDVETTVETNVDKARESILNSKFDAVVMDFKSMDLGCEVLTAARDTRLNGKTVLIAIVDDYIRHRAAFGLGANFTIPRMVTVDQAMRCLRSSYCMMVRQRRGSKRYPLHIPASGQVNNDSLGFRILNVSETGMGMGLDSASGLVEGDMFSAVFDLPGTDKSVRTTARVIWKDQQGTAGATFVQFEGETEEHLQDWINASLVDRFHL